MQVCTSQILSLYPDSNPPVASLPPSYAPPVGISPPATTHVPTPTPSPALVIPPNPSPSPSPLGTSLRRSTRANRGTWTNTKYQDELF